VPNAIRASLSHFCKGSAPAALHHQRAQAPQRPLTAGSKNTKEKEYAEGRERMRRRRREHIRTATTCPPAVVFNESGSTSPLNPDTSSKNFVTGPCKIPALPPPPPPVASPRAAGKAYQAPLFITGGREPRAKDRISVSGPSASRSSSAHRTKRSSLLSCDQLINPKLSPPIETADRTLPPIATDRRPCW